MMRALRHARADPRIDLKNLSCEARWIAGSSDAKTAIRAFCPAMTTTFSEKDS
jgi:hypothetical protein